MRRLTILVVVLALIYSAYWFIGATAAERGVQQAMDGLAEDGWQVSYDDISTRGFPSRFDTTISALDLTAPDGGLGFGTPFVQALALSYQPNHVIAAFPDTQTLRLGGQSIAVQTEGLRASAAVAADTALSLDNVTAQVGTARLTSDAGWSLTLDRAIAAVRAAGPAANTYDLYANTNALVLPETLRRLLNPLGLHPDQIANLSVETTVTLDRPIDRHALSALELDPPRVMALSLNAMTLQWGQMSITGNGDLTVSADGLPTGEITFTAINWRDMIGMAGAAGLIETGFDATLENLGAMLAQGQDRLDLALKFKDGRMSLGPIPLGSAPRFH